MTKVILYIATSADGFIADQDGGVDWLPHPNDDDLKESGYLSLMDRIDTILMGRRSYDQIVAFGDWSWKDKQTHVFTSSQFHSPEPNIRPTLETPQSFLKNRQQSGKDIWLLGGAELAQSFARKHLIDEIILTIVPQQLGSGIPLGIDFHDFELIDTKLILSNMIQKVYILNHK